MVHMTQFMKYQKQKLLLLPGHKLTYWHSTSKSNTHETSTIWMAMAAKEPKNKGHKEKWRNYRKTRKPEGETFY